MALEYFLFSLVVNNMKIAFDVDDTLIIPRVITGLEVDTPHYETIAIYNWFKEQGHYMIIWSGGGVDYARMWAEKLGLKPDAILEKKYNEEVDICFDDCTVDLAKMNIKVKRLDNSVSRAEWNKHND